ncbi:MAG: glycoside hydrolase family 16 protein, partial [Treponema sp.]|nr:glycoside hydrolase family 16 protein [Treponema sp.]
MKRFLSALTVFSSALALILVFTACPAAGEKPVDTNPAIDGIKIGDTIEGKGILVWRDEFSGKELDTDKWNYDYGSGSQYGTNDWGNAEKQYYMPQNVRVADGKLIIEAMHNDPIRGYSYSSGKITTKGTKGSAGQTPLVTNTVFPPKEFSGVTTGYVEARIKTPKGAGFWPAFWMLGADCDEYSGYDVLGWPQCGEIDIMETRGGQEYRVGQTMHYGENPYQASHTWAKSVTTDLSPSSSSSEYHVYAVGWDKSGLRFYVDGQQKLNQAFPLPEGAMAHPEAFYNDV